MRKKHSPISPNLRLQLKHGVAIGPGKAALLESIAQVGSISAAGRALGMSYKHAWLLVNSMNTHFRGPVASENHQIECANCTQNVAFRY
jgi:molybdate transport system regulatory protein